MKENGESTFYVIFSPRTTSYLLQVTPEPPFYMQYGYYISGCPFEPNGIVYKGSYGECQGVTISLCHFVMN